MALVTCTLRVCNTKVSGKVKASLRFPLPANAVVCSYRFETDAGMIEAFSVTKKTAAAVAYKEKERGRDVSTTEAVQGSTWQTGQCLVSTVVLDPIVQEPAFVFICFHSW